MQRKFINKALTGHHRLLSDAWDAVHLDRKFNSVPMDARRLRQMILEYDADAVALVRLDRRARSASVEAPEVESTTGDHGLLHRFGDQMKDLHAVVRDKRQIRDIGCD